MKKPLVVRPLSSVSRPLGLSPTPHAIGIATARAGRLWAGCQGRVCTVVSTRLTTLESACDVVSRESRRVSAITKSSMFHL